MDDEFGRTREYITSFTQCCVGPLRHSASFQDVRHPEDVCFQRNRVSLETQSFETSAEFARVSGRLCKKYHLDSGSLAPSRNKFKSYRKSESHALTDQARNPCIHEC